MSGNTSIKLSGTYTYRGEEWTFWSLAPRFATRFAVDQVPGYPRSFVWLTRGGKFLHAVVAPGARPVCAVNLNHGAAISKSINIDLYGHHRAFVGGNDQVVAHARKAWRNVIGAASDPSLLPPDPKEPNPWRGLL